VDHNVTVMLDVMGNGEEVAHPGSCYVGDCPLPFRKDIDHGYPESILISALDDQSVGHIRVGAQERLVGSLMDLLVVNIDFTCLVESSRLYTSSAIDGFQVLLRATQNNVSIDDDKWAQAIKLMAVFSAERMSDKQKRSHQSFTKNSNSVVKSNRKFYFKN
jgi:hypothetical protein